MAKRRKGGSRSGSAQHNRNIAKVRQLADWVELAAKVVCGILVVVFASLQFSKKDVELFASEPAAELIFRVAMALYLAAWSAGGVHDLRHQRDALIAPTNTTKEILNGFGFILALGFLFAMMCVVRENKTWTVLFLAAFLLLNIGAWRYFSNRIMRPMIDKSLATYAGEQDYFAVEKVKNVKNYICGAWQYYRFGIAVALAVLLNCLMLPGVSQRIADNIPGAKKHEIESSAILIYVVVIEALIWHRRILASLTRKMLEEMEIEYTLIKRP
jgi:hypothetical protein